MHCPPDADLELVLARATAVALRRQVVAAVTEPHPPRGYGSDAAYLPREVFFGRLGLAGAFFSVWASDFGRFFPATSGSFR